jgi:hypothetical protein
MRSRPPASPHALSGPVSGPVSESAAGAARPTCGARTKQKGTPCGHMAGERTDHPGEGRCWLHGGRSPVKSGRYSTIQRPALRELIAEHAADADPLDILPELAATRALFQDYLERFDAHRAALLAWHASDLGSNRPLRPDKVAALKRVLADWEADRADADGADLSQPQRECLDDAREVLGWLAREPEQKPMQLLDVADAYRIAAEVTKIVERIERIRATKAISFAVFLRVLNELGAVVERNVPDAATQQRIRDGWLEIRATFAAAA